MMAKLATCGARKRALLTAAVLLAATTGWASGSRGAGREGEAGLAGLKPEFLSGTTIPQSEAAEDALARALSDVQAGPSQGETRQAFAGRLESAARPLDLTPEQEESVLVLYGARGPRQASFAQAGMTQAGRLGEARSAQLLGRAREIGDALGTTGDPGPVPEVLDMRQPGATPEPSAGPAAARAEPSAPPAAEWVVPAPPLDLYAATPGGKLPRPDERFHLQTAQPAWTLHRLGPLRWVNWSNLVNADGSPGWFISFHLWGWQLYMGSVKCDPSRTYALRMGQLGGTPQERSLYVMTTTPKEKFALRRHKVQEVPTWDNMGGS